jgi:hypothetical protein
MKHFFYTEKAREEDIKHRYVWDNIEAKYRRFLCKPLGRYKKDTFQAYFRDSKPLISILSDCSRNREKIAAQLAFVLRGLHIMGLVHMDVHFENVLVNSHDKHKAYRFWEYDKTSHIK